MKRLALLLLTPVFCFVLLSCGGEDPGGEDASGADPAPADQPADSTNDPASTDGPDESGTPDTSGADQTPDTNDPADFSDNADPNQPRGIEVSEGEGPGFRVSLIIQIYHAENLIADSPQRTAPAEFDGNGPVVLMIQGSVLEPDEFVSRLEQEAERDAEKPLVVMVDRELYTATIQRHLDIINDAPFSGRPHIMYNIYERPGAPEVIQEVVEDGVPDSPILVPVD